MGKGWVGDAKLIIRILRYGFGMFLSKKVSKYANRTKKVYIMV